MNEYHQKYVKILDKLCRRHVDEKYIGYFKSLYLDFVDVKNPYVYVYLLVNVNGMDTFACTGFSKCMPTDVFKEEQGVTIALSRAIQDLNAIFVHELG